MGVFREEYGEDASQHHFSRIDTFTSDIHLRIRGWRLTFTHTTTPQNDASELEDEAVHRRKPEQWTDYPEPEDVEFCISPQQSVSDVDDEESASDVEDEASSPEPQELSTTDERDEEFEDDQKDDEPPEADSPESQLLSPLHESLPALDDHQADGPLEADSPEQRPLSTLHQSNPLGIDNEQQYDESIDFKQSWTSNGSFHSNSRNSNLAPASGNADFFLPRTNEAIFF